MIVRPSGLGESVAASLMVSDYRIPELPSRGARVRWRLMGCA